MFKKQIKIFKKLHETKAYQQKINKVVMHLNQTKCCTYPDYYSNRLGCTHSLLHKL